MSGESDAKPRKWFTKKRVLIPVGGLLLIGIFSSLGGNKSPADDSTTATAPTSTAGKATAPSAKSPSAAPVTPAAAAEEPADSTPKIGTAVRDGKFEFVISGVKCGIAQVGDDMLNKKAQGQFCAVSMKVTNIGDEAQSIFADNQVAYDSADHKFSADSEAGIYAADSKLLYEQINPGNSVDGKVYFDVPKGAQLVKIDLHDSAFSGGVEVALKK